MRPGNCKREEILVAETLACASVPATTRSVVRAKVTEYDRPPKRKGTAMTNRTREIHPATENSIHLKLSPSGRPTTRSATHNQPTTVTVSRAHRAPRTVARPRRRPALRAPPIKRAGRPMPLSDTRVNVVASAEPAVSTESTPRVADRPEPERRVTECRSLLAERRRAESAR